MKIHVKSCLAQEVLLFTLFVASLLPQLSVGGALPAIPEPGLIMYGSANNTNPAGNGSLSSGVINWAVSGNVSTSSVAATIVNVEGQYFYIAKIPFETRHIGATTFTATSNTLDLAAITTNYTRSATVNGSNAVISFSSRGNLGTFPFGGGLRGLVERVDLQVNLPGESFSAWALRYFGTTNISQTADADLDGASNYQEYLAGTDPNDNHSLFIVTQVISSPSGGIDVRWQSVAYKTYEVQRSTNVSQGFASLQAGIAATPSTNAYHDSSATGGGPYFYRVKLEGFDTPSVPAAFRLIDIRPDLAGGIDLRWESEANRSYSIYRSTNLSQGFINVQSALPATPGTNSFRDATATGSGPYFYRVKVD